MNNKKQEILEWFRSKTFLTQEMEGGETGRLINEKDFSQKLDEYAVSVIKEVFKDEVCLNGTKTFYISEDRLKNNLLKLGLKIE